MSENLEADALLRILNRLPSVPWSVRIDPATLAASWIYVSPRMAEIYGLTEDEVRGDPLTLLQRLEPEDAARYRQAMMVSIQTLEPMTWIGRVVHASGEARWIEAQLVFDRDADGTIVAVGQALDVTERERTERLHRAVIDALPAGVMAMTPDGKFPIFNRAAATFAGTVMEEHKTQGHGVFKTDGVTLFTDEELPLLRAIRGEEAPEVEMIFRNSRLEGSCLVQGIGAPIRDEAGEIFAAIVVMHDITRQRALEQELRSSNAQLSASEEGKLRLIEQLRAAVDDLSNPILEVWDDVLAMPVIGVVDARRTADMVQRLLAEVARSQASFVIVDLTGVEIVDTSTADYLIKLVRKVEIVGARCVLTGIRPAVSETLVEIGVDFSRITTLRNLKHGLREALRHARRERDGRHDLGDDDGERSEEPRVKAGARRRQP